MKFNISKEFIIFITVGVIVLGAFTYFLNSTYFAAFYAWAQYNIILFTILIFIIRVLSIIYPPMTGGIVTLGAIPIIGWENAFIIDFAGTTFGGAVNYYVGRNYGIKVISKIVGEDAVANIQKLKFKAGREIEGIIVARIFFGLIMLEFIHYAAGILKVDFWKYMIALIFSHFMLGIPLFYLVSKFIDFKDYWYALLPLLIILPVLYKYRHRYFEF